VDIGFLALIPIYTSSSAVVKRNNSVYFVILLLPVRTLVASPSTPSSSSTRIAEPALVVCKQDISRPFPMPIDITTVTGPAESLL
jgi:hypothetical protein